ncbi:MAG: hypothetical protein IJF82_21395, partial [Achromobacter sp.]|nr:hypothetical protein [Achromobacter sp.]
SGGYRKVPLRLQVRSLASSNGSSQSSAVVYDCRIAASVPRRPPIDFDRDPCHKQTLLHRLLEKQAQKLPKRLTQDD